MEEGNTPHPAAHFHHQFHSLNITPILINPKPDRNQLPNNSNIL